MMYQEITHHFEHFMKNRTALFKFSHAGMKTYSAHRLRLPTVNQGRTVIVLFLFLLFVSPFLEKIRSFIELKHKAKIEVSKKMEQEGKNSDTNIHKRWTFSNVLEAVYNIAFKSLSTAEQNVQTTFKDVLGIDEYREELEELVDFLKHPKRYTDSGAELPKGVLMAGPPGTGKTLMARALAGESGCTFLYRSGSEFDEVFVGVGAKRIRELFKEAREKAPCIVFIDEIDSVAPKRDPRNTIYSRDTLNQLLAEMDGFKNQDGIIVVGATNRPDVLDRAIMRPGRFDKVIDVNYPDIKGREEIFKYYLNKVKYDKSSVSARVLAQATTGMTGADIRNMVNIAVLNCIKEERDLAKQTDFEHAIDRITMGISLHLQSRSWKERHGYKR